MQVWSVLWRSDSLFFEGIQSERLSWIKLYINEQGEVVAITEAEFDEFIPVIAKAFPNGFTIYDATGGYYDSGLQKTITERSKVLEIVVPKSGSKKSIRSFAKIMNEYTKRFKQSGQFWTKAKCEFHSS